MQVSLAVLGGEPVFANTRLSIHYIGSMVAKGLIDEMKADYSYLHLTDEDFIFSSKYDEESNRAVSA